jgi:hypothetical protein
MNNVNLLCKINIMEECNLIKLYEQLPKYLVHEICLYTGKFILRYDKKLNKNVLVSIINFADKQWIRFNYIYFDLYNKRRYKRGDCNCYLSHGGDLFTHVYLNVTLPPLPSDIQISEKNTKPRRRGDKKRYKMQFR